MKAVLLLLPLLSSALVSQGPGKNVGGKHVNVKLKAGTERCGPENGVFKGGLTPPKAPLSMESNMSMDDLPTFYLHEEFVDAKPVIDCFHKAKGSKPGVDEFDFKLMPDTAEHMVDIWLLEQLQKHPKRIYNEGKAKLHIVGFPIFNSYAGGRFWKCGSHEDRMSELVDKMTANKWYKKKKGKNFLVFATAPDAERVFTPPLIELAKKGRVIVATADKNYPSIEPFEKKVVIPYKGMHLIEGNAWDPKGKIPKANQRNQTFMFHGDVQKGKRSVLAKIREELPDADIQDHDFQHMGMAGFKKVVEFTTAAYLNTKFCLVVEGSTPTSRRLFDSLAAGCVPIMIGGEEGIRRNLPFQKTIDWSKLVYYGGDLDCVSKNYVGEQNFLKEFLKRPESEMDERRQLGVKVFKESLSYRGHGIVDALLREVEV